MYGCEFAAPEILPVRDPIRPRIFVIYFAKALDSLVFEEAFDAARSFRCVDDFEVAPRDFFEFKTQEAIVGP